MIEKHFRESYELAILDCFDLRIVQNDLKNFYQKLSKLTGYKQKKRVVSKDSDCLRNYVSGDLLFDRESISSNVD